MSAARGLLTLLRLPHLRALLALRQDWLGFTRLHFLDVALRSGLLQAVRARRA